jgi:hypothetical protein
MTGPRHPQQNGNRFSSAPYLGGICSRPAFTWRPHALVNLENSQIQYLAARLNLQSCWIACVRDLGMLNY